jgi:membrane-bound lytic murein transglycosylase B
MGRATWIAAALSACGLLLGASACAESSAPIEFPSSGNPGFDAWRAGFAERALAQGRGRETVLSLLSGLSPDDRVLEADRRQPEFTSPVWDYVTRTVSDRRIAEGRRRRADSASLFAAVEARYGVDPDIIAAIWAMESNFGGVELNHEAPRALATLAYEGRRRVQFERFLVALIEMVERGYAGPEELKSSWAGALGQPQFMPDVFLTLATDWDGDGKRDIWTNEGDVIASIANYLADRGWRRGEAVFDEVRLPAGFDLTLADLTLRPVAEWETRGVRRIDNLVFGEAERALFAQLFLPAGAQGPALLLYPNFQVIKRYNNSDRYALSVSLLARGFAGRGGLVASWPRQVGALNRDEILELQTLLNAQGLNAGPADGLFGANTRSAVRAFQQAENLPPDGYPSAALLARLRVRAGVTAAEPAEAEAPSPRAPQLSVARVRELQRLLRRLGFRPGPADGAVGERTREAIRDFERSVGRRITGEATPPVLRAAQRAARRRG